MPEGIVYVLTNSAMDDIIKIGRTDNLQQRMRSLYTAGVPAPFTCYYAARVAEAEQVERNVHEIFANERVNKQREFFSTDPHRAALVIKMVGVGRSKRQHKARCCRRRRHYGSRQSD